MSYMGVLRAVAGAGVGGGDLVGKGPGVPGVLGVLLVHPGVGDAGVVVVLAGPAPGEADDRDAVKRRCTALWRLGRRGAVPAFGCEAHSASRGSGVTGGRTGGCSAVCGRPVNAPGGIAVALPHRPWRFSRNRGCPARSVRAAGSAHETWS